MADILHRIEIAAPIARVREALTTNEGLAGWWTRDVAREGDVLSFRFGARRFGPDMRVTESGPSRVAWTCVAGSDEWLGTKLSFDLEQAGERTIVRFGHREWKEASDFLAHCS